MTLRRMHADPGTTPDRTGRFARKKCEIARLPLYAYIRILALQVALPHATKASFAMRDDLVSGLLRHLQGVDDWKLGRCPRQAEDTLKSLELPAGLSRLLTRSWVNEKHAYAGTYLLRTASEIAADPWLLVLRTHRML